MTRMMTIQTYGTLVVIGAFALSECAARFLDACPASDLAWYLNVVVFRSFERARIGSSPLRGLFGPQSLPLALASMAVVIGLHRIRFRLGIALAANVAFVAACLFAHIWFAAASVGHAASLRGISGYPDGETWTVAVVLAASFVAFSASHAGFAAAIQDDRNCALAGARPA
jgi:hypothetical protein